MDGFKSMTLSKKKKRGEREPETMKPTLYDSIFIPSGQAKEKKFYEVKNYSSYFFWKERKVSPNGQEKTFQVDTGTDINML